MTGSMAPAPLPRVRWRPPEPRGRSPSRCRRRRESRWRIRCRTRRSPRARLASCRSRASPTRRFASWRNAMWHGSTKRPRGTPCKGKMSLRCSPTWPGPPAWVGATSATGRAWCSGMRDTCARACLRCMRRTKARRPRRRRGLHSPSPTTSGGGPEWARPSTGASRSPGTCWSAARRRSGSSKAPRCSRRCSDARKATPFSTIPPGRSRQPMRWSALSLRCGPASGCDPASCSVRAPARWRRHRLPA